jgi:hypothetical protein
MSVFVLLLGLYICFFNMHFPFIIYALILARIVHTLYRIDSSIIHFFYVRVYTEKFRLSGGLPAYLTTFS